MNEFITVYAEQPPNPESMKFVVSKMIFPNQSAEFKTIEKAKDEAPLAFELFTNFSYVTNVFIMNNFLTITKTPGAEWKDHIPELREFIKTYLEQGKEVVIKKTVLSDENADEVVQKIIKLLDDNVKPAVEMDGGAIEFKSFEQGVVKVVMRGSCSGCPSSTFTLKNGIENLLKRMIPEVESVEAEMD